ncbi:integrin beta-1-like [Ruditapes philippinarum]|uniref:integrin beta-1-like n=1 Tax=Ruditapes philippinarum TaxID=129788 RepID=UPI00295AE523|nr:integrin beta-1-like [Ruditapes philippinarum]
MFDKDKCQISYLILCENDTIHLHLAKNKLCVSPPDPLLIALPVLGGIIGVGLLLLIIWKILTSFYDKIEYAKFEHEIQDPKWSKTDNPIYKTPVTSNQNPVYKGTVDD